MAWDPNSTIVAIASGTAGAVRGIVRLSGPAAWSSMAAIASNVQTTGLKWSENPHSARRYGITLEWGHPLGPIDANLWVWPEGKSYTGQLSVEVHCIGCLPILQAIVDRLTEQGVRPAEPGEFTMRAFLAGRLDLAQCEAVLGVIHAESQRSLHLALEQLSGGLQLPVRELRNSLIELLADIEAGLDFVDEDIQFITQDEILIRLEKANTCIQTMLDQLRSRRRTNIAPQVVLVGNPNTGKSTLANKLLGRKVAIVADTPGTTRDFLRTTLSMDEAAIELIDTAGLEAYMDDSPRGMAQEMTQKQWLEADLLLVCLSMHQNPSDLADRCAWLTSTLENRITTNDHHPEYWILGTQADRCDAATTKEFMRCMERFCPAPILITSGESGQGIDALRAKLCEWANARSSERAAVLPSTASRCIASLQRSLESLQYASDYAVTENNQECVASELRLALSDLGTVIGEVYTDDILDSLFSRFCIGK